MSHKATSWLSTLPADWLGHSEFRVLFHLCDCHNPSQGCYPTQSYLVTACGMSRSTVNVALGALEDKGLIKRHQSVDLVTRRQRPTRYMLGFEIASAQGPCPKSGHGNSPAPSPNSGHGAVSDFRPEPCPENGKSRVRSTGHKPVNKPVRNRAPMADGGSDLIETGRKMLVLLAEKISAGGYVPASAIRPDQARAMVSQGLIDETALRRIGVAF